MALSDVKIIKGNGGLGRRNPSVDGTSGLLATGVAVENKLELGKVYKLQTLSDVQALGLNPDYDSTHAVLLFYQISEVFRLNPDITLFLMVADQAAKMADLLDPTKSYAPKLLADADFSINQLAVALNPAADYAATTTDGIDAQVLAAVSQAQLLANYADELHAPLSAIGLEGLQFAGNVTNAKDLHTLAANKVSVVIAQDGSAQAAIDKPNHAAIGAWLGLVSLAKVHENIGWPEKFGVTNTQLGRFLKPNLSGGTAVSSYTLQQLNQLDDKGYLFAISIPQLPGLYFNDSYTCTPLNDDFNRSEMNRTMDKAIKAVRGALVPKLKSPLYVEQSTGQLDPATIVIFETLAQAEVDIMVADGELSGATVFVDPVQNVLANNLLEVEVSIIPVGSAHTIQVKIGFSNPFKNS